MHRSPFLSIQYFVNLYFKLQKIPIAHSSNQFHFYQYLKLCFTMHEFMESQSSSLQCFAYSVFINAPEAGAVL